LNDEVKWLVIDHCLYDDGKRYELEIKHPRLGGEQSGTGEAHVLQPFTYRGTCGMGLVLGI